MPKLYAEEKWRTGEGEKKRRPKMKDARSPPKRTLRAGVALTSAVGDVPAPEPVAFAPVEQTGEFQQQSRGEEIAGQRREEVENGRHGRAESERPTVRPGRLSQPF